MTSAGELKWAAGFAGRNKKAIQMCLIAAIYKEASPEAISNDEAFARYEAAIESPKRVAELIGLLTDEEGEIICKLANKGKR